MREIPAGIFKAKCLSIMKEVQTRREPVVVTKNGTPVVKMMPMEIPEDKDPLDAYYFGKIEIIGDIISSPYSDEEWEAFEQASTEQLK